MKRTTGARLQKMIAGDLVSIISVVVSYDERGAESISVDKFKEDLEFYINSGVFSDTIDFSFEKNAEDTIRVAIGRNSCYCDNVIDVILQLNGSGVMETVVNQLDEDLDERLSA